MKKIAILLIGLSAMAFGGLLLSLAACKTEQIVEFEDSFPVEERGVVSDLAYGYKLVHAGETFPDTALKAPGNPQDRSYLGLKSDAAFSIKDIKADLVLVEFLNIYCVHCQKQAPAYNDLFEMIEADALSQDQIKMIAVGIGNNEDEIKSFREKYKILFPIVADQRFELHDAVGGPGTPFSVLVRLEESSGTAMVALTYSGVKEDYKNVYEDMQALKTLDLAVLRKKGLQTEAKVYTVEPPLSQSEIEALIKKSMTKLGARDDDLTQFRKVPFEGHHVYTGVKDGKESTERLFAKVVSRPTICDVCHDVHFFYIFNNKGEVLDFVPLQLTKWGNEQWSEKDVRLMRDRLVGRFIFTPFEFNPQVDAVTSATITSVVIFDGMSQGKEIFEFLRQEGSALEEAVRRLDIPSASSEVMPLKKKKMR